jgi:O-antigen ligase
MSISTYYNKIIEYRDRHVSTLSTWANHLIVVFAFFIPLSMGGRQSSLFLIFIVFLLRGKWLQYIKEGLKDKLVQAFAIYFLVHIVWLIGTDNFIYAQKVVHQAKFLLYPLLFIILIDKQYIPRIFAAFLLGMLCGELWSYGIFFEILPPNIHDGNQGNVWDPTPVHHHTHYGFMLAVTLTLILQRFYHEHDSKPVKIMIVLFFVTATANIFITAGRTGYVLYAVLLVTLYILLHRKKLAYSITGLLILVVCAFSLAYNFSETFQKRLVDTARAVESIYHGDNYYSSIGVRAGVVVFNKGLVLDNWLFGVGTGDQLDEVRENVSVERPGYAGMVNGLQHLHNEFLRAILQFGIIGLLSFLYIIYQLFRYPQEDADKKNLQIILAVAIFWFSFVDIVVHGQGMLLTTVLLISLTLRRYITEEAVLPSLNKLGIMKYGVAVVLIELISRYS